MVGLVDRSYGHFELAAPPETESEPAQNLRVSRDKNLSFLFLFRADRQTVPCRERYPRA